MYTLLYRKIDFKLLSFKDEKAISSNANLT